RVIPKRAGLRRAASRAGDRVPSRWKGLAGSRRPRVQVQGQDPFGSVAKVDRWTLRRVERQVGKILAEQMVAGSVVDRNRQIPRNPGVPLHEASEPAPSRLFALRGPRAQVFNPDGRGGEVEAP